jgi:hypothetical protein
MIACGFGGALLGLAAVAARSRSGERAVEGAYLAQGLAMVTIGLAAKLTGPQLAVVLAAESAGLLVASRARQRVLFEISAGLCALGAGALAVFALQNHQTRPVALGLPVIAFFIADAWLVKWAREEFGQFCERAAGFAVLGLAVLADLLWVACPGPWLPTAFGLAAVGSLVALRGRLPEVAVPGQLFLLAALAIFIERQGMPHLDPQRFGAPLIVIAVALMHWWQHQKALELDEKARALAQLACAAVATIVGYEWVQGACYGDARLVATSVAALGCLGYGLITRGWALAATGQVFTVIGAVSFGGMLVSGDGSRWPMLAPVLAVAGTQGILGVFVGDRALGGVPLGSVRRVYRYAALAMLGAWAFVYVEPAWRVAFYAGLGTAFVALGAVRKDVERRSSGAIYGAFALLVFWGQSDQLVGWRELLAIVAIPAGLRLGQRLCGETPVLPKGRDELVGGAVASLWLFATRWMEAHGHLMQLTAAWAVLALLVFGAGLALRERIYRLGGFGILGLAVARLFIIDVWRFDTLPRIVSFLVLGVVLLVLSFVYNRFADVLRRWL